MSDLITVSSIREKFPMYADMPDEQLLGAIRKKYYADIPMNDFVKRIDFDTERARLNPVNDMSGLDTFRAGIGKGMSDIGRGVGQALGLTSRADVGDARKLDAGLMRSTSGTAGSVLGSIAALLPTAMVPGANTYAGAAGVGALTGILSPSESTGETLKNAGIGGIAGPAAIGAGRALAAGYQGLRGLIQPLTEKGQEAIAANTLRQFARDPQAAASALRSTKPLVPGSLPTMGQASGDSGLAQLERTLVNNPETGPDMAARFAQQRAARLGAVKDIAGTDEYYNAIREGRKVFANEDYAAAMTQGVDRNMADAMQPQIASLLERPSIQEAKGVAKSLAKENGTAIDNFASLEGLDWLKKALDNKIDQASSVGSSIGKEKLRALIQTKSDLMATMEQIAPAYKVANDNYAQMSRQVNSMDVARQLQSKYEPALARFGAGGREQANSYATALESALESVKKTTGQNRPLSAMMPPNDIRTLTNVAHDLGRKAAAEDAGRAVGSNTAQNLAAQNALRRALGPTGLPQTWSESTMLQTMLAPFTGIYKLGGAERKITDRLTRAALDPGDAASLLEMQFANNPGLLWRLSQYLPGPASYGLLSPPGQ